jgi:hypothetical protein
MWSHTHNTQAPTSTSTHDGNTQVYTPTDMWSDTHNTQAPTSTHDGNTQVYTPTDMWSDTHNTQAPTSTSTSTHDGNTQVYTPTAQNPQQSHKSKTTANGPPRDTAHTYPKRSSFSEQHTVSRHTRTCSLICAHNKSTALPAPIFTKLAQYIWTVPVDTDARKLKNDFLHIAFHETQRLFTYT